MKLNLPKEDWKFWLWWAAASLGAYLIAMQYGIVYPYASIPSPYIHILLLSTFQWLLLREWLYKAYYWIPVSFFALVGSIELWPVLSIAYAEYMPAFITGSDAHLTYYLLTQTLIRSFLIALIQFLLLKRETPKANWWLLGLPLSEAVVTLLNIPVYQRMISSAMPAGPAPLLPDTVHLTLTVGLGGLIAGAFMMWILKIPEEVTSEPSESIE